jgi:4-nitrophenyl phosphatase
MAIPLAAIRHMLIDMDGVMYRGATALPGASDLISFLDDNTISYLLVTNNSTLSQAQFSQRLAGMGIPVPEERIITSAVATAAYLSTLAPAGTRVNVIGEDGLVGEIRKRGFVLAGREAEYVVVGWDKTINFDKLKTACLAIRDGATFIGTNPDKTYPLEHDIIPGAGSILAALVAATDVQPLVVGKPEPIIIEQSLRILGARAEETASLGDRLDTDILGGHRAGTTTILVLTGIATAEEVERAPVQPDYVFRDLTTLLARWRPALTPHPVPKRSMAGAGPK